MLNNNSQFFRHWPLPIIKWSAIVATSRDIMLGSAQTLRMMVAVEVGEVAGMEEQVMRETVYAIDATK